jgi:hypothetical protein
MAHGYVTSHHIDDGSGHEKWGNAAGAAIGQFDLGVFDQGQAPDTGPDHATDASS